MHKSLLLSRGTRSFSFKASAMFLALFIVPSGVIAKEQTAGENQVTVHKAFAGESPDSNFSIQYDDLDIVLKQIVLETGRSNRSRPSKVRAAAGSRIVRGSKGRYALEGNRVLFPALSKPENLALLTKIRQELEAVPGQLPLRLLNKNEQLAYWLNLYNVTVLEQVALMYPQKRLKKQFNSDQSLWDKKLLTVAGRALSLNDIQHKIVNPKFKNPLVMYGMWQGFVGGPNIRNQAFRGETVYSQLRENADEFINSNRGMHANERLLRVSHLYSVNEALFPNWNNDMRAHLTRFANGNYRDRIRKASRLSPKISGYDVADLYSGTRHRGSAVSTNAAAFLGAVEAVQYGSTAEGHFGASTYLANDGGQLASILVPKLQASVRDGGRFPSHVMQYLLEIDKRNKAKGEGDVTVEELGVQKKQAPNASPETESHSVNEDETFVRR